MRVARVGDELLHELLAEQTVRAAALEDDTGLDPRHLKRAVDDLSGRKAGAQEQERLGRELGQRDRPLACKPIPCRDHREDASWKEHARAKRRWGPGAC
jgi:hypothetical protein